MAEAEQPPHTTMPVGMSVVPSTGTRTAYPPHAPAVLAASTGTTVDPRAGTALHAKDLPASGSWVHSGKGTSSQTVLGGGTAPCATGPTPTDT